MYSRGKLVQQDISVERIEGDKAINVDANSDMVPEVTAIAFAMATSGSGRCAVASLRLKMEFKLQVNVS